MTERSPIMVTGGAGFIGSHACKALSEAGHLPVTLDNLSTGNREAVKWGPLVVADLQDTAAVQAALQAQKVDMVMHFAASAYVGESMANPALYYQNNVGGMTSLLAACTAAGVTKVILSSSCATYGIPERMPITEDTAQNPVNPYGRTKLICEQMLKDFESAHGIRHVALRYFNAAGADPDGELFECHDPETHLIPLALMAAAGQRGPLDVFGADYATRDGSCERDYIHVSDLARGHLQSVDYLNDGGESCALNLGSGQGHTVLEVLDAVRQATGVTVPYNMSPRRAGDPPALLADPSRAARVIGFEARCPDLIQIIRDAAPSFGLTPPMEETNARIPA